ncbi:hypothetical protein CBR_g58305 [Chara braunii]|uniref:Uncharacterized protein n=1 Tax=Chara braunii TaxID=69332 RepID=A0A388MEP8_CHABU|nr:hypothetical protein CBR_g58305 [Chara braunii]|eukprot:GBG93037.1 hypothetical protein CBR_g58305 [Chara braunii]
MGEGLNVKPLEWYDQYAYSSDRIQETEEERDTFLAKLASIDDQKEKDLMLEEKCAKLHSKILAAKRQELEERKILQIGARLQKELQEQKNKQIATEEKLALLTETVLHTKQEVATINRTLQKVETNQYEFEGIWNTFLEKFAKDVDRHIKSYIEKLDNHITQTFTPAVIERIVKGSGGGGGDGDGDGDGRDDKKGKGVQREEGARQINKIKVKIPWTYTGKKYESVLHWIAAVESYVYGQRIPYWDRVLMASSCMGGDAMSFAISLQKEAGCSSMVEYSQQNRIEDFLKAVIERFQDKNLARRTKILILNLPDRKWKSTSALKATMDELLQCNEHGLTPTQILNSFARALPNPLRTQLYPRTKEEGMTYEKFNKIALDHAGFLAEANYCHYRKDLQAGKKWQNRTISGSIPGKDNILLTFEKAGVVTLSWDQVDYGLEEGPNGLVAKEGSYAAVAARRGGRQGRGRGRGRGGRGRGGRGPGIQRGGGEGSYYTGGRGNGPSQGGRGSDSAWGRGSGTWYNKWDKPYPPHPGVPKGEPWKKLGITEKVWQERKVVDQCLKCGDPDDIVPYCRDYKVAKGSSL